MRKIIVTGLLSFLFVLLSFSQLTYDGNTYIYTDPSSGKRIHVWVPETDSMIYGLFMDGNAGTGAGSTNNPPMQDFARRFKFGIMATSFLTGSNTYNENSAIIVAAFNAISNLGHNPEMKYVPLIPYGSSSAGANAYGLTNYMPNRVICLTPNVPYECVGGNPDNTLDATLNIPTLFSSGPLDYCYTEQVNIVANARSRGGHWGFVIIQNMGHEHRRTQFLNVRMWEKMIASRYPKNQKPIGKIVDLIPYPYDSGWIADQNTFNSGYTSIVPVQNFSGNVNQSSWLIDEEIAVLYRTLTSYNSPFRLYVENLPDFPVVPNDYAKYKPGDVINLECNVSKYTNWKKIEFFRSLKKIGEVYHVKGVNDNIASLAVKLGYESYAQPFYVEGTDASNVKKTTELYTVMVYDNGKPSEPTPVNVDVNDQTKPSRPVNINVIDNKTTNLKVNWDPSVDNNAIKGYEVYINGALVLFNTSNYFSLDSLVPGYTYKNIRVLAVDLNGNKSDSSDLFTFATTPTMPLNLTATVVTQTAITFTWSASSSSAGTKKYVLLGSLVSPDSIKIETTATTSTVTGLLPGTRYYFTLHAVDNNNNSSDTSERKYVRTTRASTELSAVNTIEYTLFPNPVINGIANLEIEGIANNQNSEISIVDFTGKVVLSKTIVTNTCELDCSSFRAGIYVIVVTTDKFNKSFKFIIE